MTNQYHPGQWLRVQLRSAEMIGQITGFGQHDNQPTIIIKNAIGGAEVYHGEVIGPVNPLEEWDRLHPDQPVPAWLIAPASLTTTEAAAALGIPGYQLRSYWATHVTPPPVKSSQWQGYRWPPAAIEAIRQALALMHERWTTTEAAEALGISSQAMLKYVDELEPVEVKGVWRWDKERVRELGRRRGGVA